MAAQNNIVIPNIATRTDKLERNLLLILGVLASMTSALIYLFGIPLLWSMSWFYGILFTMLGIAQLFVGCLIIIQASQIKVLLSMGISGTVILLWLLVRLIKVLPAPDPWIPLNSVIGFTDYICATLELVAIIAMFLGLILHIFSPTKGKVIVLVATVPLMVLIFIASFLGLAASSNGFTGLDFPPKFITGWHLPSGQMSTVEYCHPDKIPLAMDIYMPNLQSNTDSLVPVVVYAHGGGLWGNRQMQGLGAKQANQQGALFPILQKQLNAAGFVVASIDYRLPPGTSWPAQIEDAKCAIRSLRAHANDLDIDPDRIGVWGSSFGGYLATLLGLTGSQTEFETGQYLNQSSSVQAVVDMFGPSDLQDSEDISSFGQFIMRIIYGNSETILHSASPITYVTSDAPPFLILHGTEDPLVNVHQSVLLTRQLQAVGVPVDLIKVHGAEHSLATPDEIPNPDELSATIVQFFVEVLK